MTRLLHLLLHKAENVAPSVPDDQGTPRSEGAPGRIRTCDRRIRSPVLYPAELRAPGPQVDLRLCKIQHIILDRLRAYDRQIRDDRVPQIEHSIRHLARRRPTV